MEKNIKESVKKNSFNTIKDVDPADVLEVITRIGKIITDWAKPESKSKKK